MTAAATGGGDSFREIFLAQTATREKRIYVEAHSESRGSAESERRERANDKEEEEEERRDGHQCGRGNYVSRREYLGLR